MTIRDSLLEALRAVVGPDRSVHVIAYQDNADVLDRRTIMLKQSTIAPLPEAPAGSLRIDYVLTFISPHVDPSLAEADLDEWVPAALADLRMPWFVWTGAEKVAFNAQNLAYDVRAYVIATPKNEGV